MKPATSAAGFNFRWGEPGQEAAAFLPARFGAAFFGGAAFDEDFLGDGFLGEDLVGVGLAVADLPLAAFFERFSFFEGSCFKNLAFDAAFSGFALPLPASAASFLARRFSQLVHLQPIGLRYILKYSVP